MPKKVLIVDDALVDRNNLERIVTEAGHVAITAASGVQAVERAKKDKPDLVFMDVNMPEMDGFAATRQLLADEATKHIQIVMVTSKNQTADKAWGQMLGARGYVTKPYTAAQIIAELNA